MAKKKEYPEPIARACNCWLDVETCYCDLENKSIRYSVRDNAGRTHSRWDTLNEAMKDGRKRVPSPFTVWDSLEQRTLIHYYDDNGDTTDP